MTACDTIFATSSGAPPAAIAIVRLSGPAAFAIGSSLVGTLPRPRVAALRAIRHPQDNALLDRALVLAFPAPQTATGEDVVELHVHGGRAVVAAVEAAIALHPTARHAEPGEFTRRALENGVIDLIAAEGLGDLLTAETETQRRAALRMAEGGLRTVINGWTERLLGIGARVEAQLDFSDEDDISEEAIEPILREVAALYSDIERLLQQPPVERLHNGLRIVIAGPPNSGKSTLLNALTDRDVAIVSPISGTTRDRIEAGVVRNGVAYVLTDTAGLTDTPGDEIERVGVARARDALAAADLVLWLGDAMDLPSCNARLHVHARADVPGREITQVGADISVSASTGLGMAALWDQIASSGTSLLPQEDAITTNKRQRLLLGAVAMELRAGGKTTDLLILAEHIRLALHSLHAITGKGGIENVLDALFAKFCIGK